MVRLYMIRIALLLATVGWLPSAWAGPIGKTDLSPFIAPKLLDASTFQLEKPAIFYIIEANKPKTILPPGVKDCVAIGCEDAPAATAPAASDAVDAPSNSEQPVAAAEPTDTDNANAMVVPPTFDPAVPPCDSGFTWSEEFAACVAKGVVTAENTDAQGTLSLTTETTATAAEGGCSLTHVRAAHRLGWLLWGMLPLLLLVVCRAARARHLLVAVSIVAGIVASPALQAADCAPNTVYANTAVFPVAGGTAQAYALWALADGGKGTITSVSLAAGKYSADPVCRENGDLDPEKSLPDHVTVCGLPPEVVVANAYEATLTANINGTECTYVQNLNTAAAIDLTENSDGPLFCTDTVMKDFVKGGSIFGVMICAAIEAVVQNAVFVVKGAIYDFDLDGIPSLQDNCPYAANKAQKDTDGDGLGDSCDTTDNTPVPTDNTGGGTVVTDTDIDTDGDGVLDATDNCPNIANTDQADTFGTTAGDACEAVVDPNLCADKVVLSDGSCPCNTGEIYNPAGNVCLADVDTDGDGIIDGADRCPATADPTNACTGTGATPSVAPTKTNTKQPSADGGEGCSIVTDATPPTSFYGLLTILVVTAALAITRQFRRRG